MYRKEIIILSDTTCLTKTNITCFLSLVESTEWGKVAERRRTIMVVEEGGN
jgi:hypothetical protein